MPSTRRAGSRRRKPSTVFRPSRIPRAPSCPRSGGKRSPVWRRHTTCSSWKTTSMRSCSTEHPARYPSPPRSDRSPGLASAPRGRTRSRRLGADRLLRAPLLRRSDLGVRLFRGKIDRVSKRVPDPVRRRNDARGVRERELRRCGLRIERFPPRRSRRLGVVTVRRGAALRMRGGRLGAARRGAGVLRRGWRRF